jgi:hypothetical protein
MSQAQMPKPMSRFDRWAQRVGLAFLVLLVVAQNVAVARVWFCQIRAASYPTTEGTILGHKQVLTQSGKSTKLAVEYAYELNGIQWVSERYWYESLVPSPPTDSEVAYRFPVGARVPVSYDPANPADAVLISGLQGVDVLAVWFLVFLDLGLLLLVRSERHEFEAEYSTTRPPGARSGWRLVLFSEPLGRSFGCVLVFAIPITFLTIPVSLGSFPTLWDVVKLTALLLTVVGLWVWLLRKKIWLDVDTDKRELRWHAGELFAGTFTIPFETVLDIRIEELEYIPGNLQYRVEIDWYSSKHRTRTTHLPTCPDGAAVEAAVVRLRETVFGAAGPPQLPAEAAP